MALYVSQRTRQRNLLIAVVSAAVLAGGLGVVVGRQQVPSISERVSKVSTNANDVATGVERLDIEYEQVLSGGGDTVEAGVLEPLRSLRVQMQRTLDEAPWVSARERRDVIDSFSAIESAAKNRVPVAAFDTVLQTSGAIIRTTVAGAK
jgi:outer membrane murein-binding lipoprotein Lpp